GSRDLLTPVGYSRAMAAALWDCELVIVGGAGHLVQLEEPDVIDDALVRLVERATPRRGALTRRLRRRAEGDCSSLRHGVPGHRSGHHRVRRRARPGAARG